MKIKKRYIIFWLLSIWGISISLKFLLTDFSNFVYIRNELDTIFDWGILWILSTIAFILSLSFILENY